MILEFKNVEKNTINTIRPNPLIPDVFIHSAPAAPNAVGILDALNR